MIVLLAGVLGITTNAEAYLHPQTGRFVQRDPKDSGKSGGGYHDGMNLYEYVRSDPVGHADSTGLYAVDVHRSLVRFLALSAGFNTEGKLGCGELTPERVGNEVQLVDEDDRRPEKGGTNIHFANWKQ